LKEKQEKFDFTSIGKRVLTIESAAIARLKDQLDNNFDIACQLCLDSPSFFVHPGEASHGDLGMISRSDVVVALSNSGKTEEIVSLLPMLKNMGIKIIAMTGDNNSKIATASDVHIDVGVEEEACPMNLSPTASTTAALAMGDAIAVALLEKRGFSVEDFAKSHPGGSIGKKLLLLVKDIMHTDKQIPIVFQDQKLAQGLIEMSEKALGMTAVINETGELVGIFTDGDLRRTLEANVDIQTTLMREVMTQNCITVSPDFLAVKAVEIIQDNKITSLAVVEENKIVGALNIHDLFRAGVM